MRRTAALRWYAVVPGCFSFCVFEERLEAMSMLSRMGRTLAALGTAVLTLLGCDQQRINALEEGLSTEADVRAQFGQPATIWPEADGARTFEYNRQPQGHQNYMITIGPDGTMTALRQVLTPHVFAQVQPGMSQEQVRRLLGQPARRTTYDLKQETDWDWHWIDAPTRQMVFTVTFGRDGRVLRAGSHDQRPDGP